MRKPLIQKLLAGLLAFALVFSLIPASLVTLAAEEESGAPAALDIGYPVFKNTELLDEVYNLEKLGVSYAEDDLMMAIYQQDLANGGDSFYFDRVLAREGVANGDAGSNGNNDGNTFMTRGRALYMYTSSPRVIGFGGNTAYHQPLNAGNMYAITFHSEGRQLSTSETTSKRVNYPSNWVSLYTVGSNLTADVTKFINQENVAVTAITLTNISQTEQTVTVQAASDFVSEQSTVEIGGTVVPELIGTVSSPANLTTITTRLTGNGFDYAESEHALSRELTLAAGESVDLKVVMGWTTEEIPASTTDYIRLAELGNLEAIRAQKAEYNLYWAENVPYIDVENKAVQKAIDYRWWLERFNSLDANIPGYDYQYPITIEGVLGYNNAIVLTQSMHLQDTKWLRSPYLAYGQILSVGNSSQSSAFLDNPGNRNNWNNHYGQYIAEAGLEAFNVIGGGAEVAENFAYYFGHDATGQLEHYGNHIDGRSLIAYRNNYMTGNDADTISMHAPGTGTWKAHGENAYVWAAADAAATLYEQLGDTKQATVYRELADKIQTDVLELMWCEQCQKFETYAVRPTSAQHNTEQPNLVLYTESNNYNYFAVGMVPTDETSIAKYKEALKTFTNGEEFPIFPFYTANQVHNQSVSGSNNFSNINFTVQLRAYEAALRTYDVEQEYVTDDMLAMMAEWMAWNVYPDAGDIRYPNNNEFHNIDGRTLDNYYRSWIYHNILGNYIYLFIEDMAGLLPRADEKIELDPIVFPYDHFMVNNVRYHGHDLTIVWDEIGDEISYYADRPEGYSLYLDGELVFTLSDLVHVIYDTTTGELTFQEGETAEVLTKNAGKAIPTAMNTAITDTKVLAMLEKSGIHGLTNLAEGAEVTATFTPDTARAASWAEKHRADGSDATSTAVNETLPDPQAVTDGTTVNMPFWGNYNSPNSKDSLVLKLDAAQTVDMATLYFYNDRQNGGYAEPAKYTVEYWDGEAWQQVSSQSREPAVPRANYNAVYFEAVTTDQLRFTFTNLDGHYTAVTEIQVFSEGGDRSNAPVNTAPTVTIKEDLTQVGNLHTAVKATVVDDGMPYDKDMTYAWTLVSFPEGADALLSSANKPSTTITGTVEGDYTLRLTVNDGEYAASAEITVTLVAAQASGLGEDVAPDADVESDYTASWEKLSGINNEEFEPASSNVGTGQGWGNWGGTSTEPYVGYIWTDPVTIGGADIYWYDDNGGTRVPAAYRMAYLDTNGEWQDVNILTPYESTVALNQYNRIMFDAVTTTQLRLYMTKSAAGTGIYRFKVYASVDIASLDEIFLCTMPGVLPTLPTTVSGRTSAGNLISVPVIWETLTEEMIASDGEVQLKGVNTATGKMTTATIYVRSDMDQATITSVAPVEVTAVLGTVPSLPKYVKVGYNNGAYDNQNVKVTWPAITAADLANVGDYSFEGEVEGTATVAQLTIHVVPDPGVTAVEEAIDAIGEVTLESAEKIKAARTAYKELPPAKRALVSNYEVLLAAERAYKALLPDDGTTILAMSDFQGSGNKTTVPAAIASVMQQAGVDADQALLLGDYVDGSVYGDGSNTSQAQMMEQLAALKDTLLYEWPLLDFLAIQGNHDYSGFVTDGTLDATGSYEYEDYVVYLINEDDFPWWQGGYSTYSDSAACKEIVEQTASNLETYLNSLILSGDTRPVIIATHVPMHWSPRSTTGQTWWNDNIYANILFDVVNDAGSCLDIVFLFGHNHSSYSGVTNGVSYDGYDQDIGGALAYVGKGETMRVPNASTGSTNYTTQTLNFTYMNGGYIGNYNGSQDDCSISAITITDDAISIDRYAADGLREENSVVIERGDFSPVLKITQADEVDTHYVGQTQSFNAQLFNAEAISYAWTCDESVATISGADSEQATLTYVGTGSIVLKCVVTCALPEGGETTLTATYSLTVEEAPEVSGYLQITSLDELSEEDTYLIVAWEGFGSEDSFELGHVFYGMEDALIGAKTEDAYQTATGAFDESCYWKLTCVDGKLTMQNVATGLYLADSIPAASETAYGLTIASGEVEGYSNFAIGTESNALRYDSTTGKFAFDGEAPDSVVNSQSDSNLTIYRVMVAEDSEAVKAAKQALRDAELAAAEAKAAQEAAEEAVAAAEAAQKAAEEAAALAGENQEAAKAAADAAAEARAKAEEAQQRAEETADAALAAQEAAEEAQRAAEENNALAAQAAAEAARDALAAAADAADAAEYANTAALHAAEAAASMREAQAAQVAAEEAQKAAEEAQKKAEEAKAKAEEAAASTAEDKAAAEKAKLEAEEAQKAAEEAQKAAEDAQAAAELAMQAAQDANKEAAAAAALAAQYAQQMAETYEEVVRIKAELVEYLAQAQAAAEKAEEEARATEEARKAAEQAALEAARYAAMFELAELLNDGDALLGHCRDEYMDILENARTAIDNAETADEVFDLLAELKAALLTVGCPSEQFTDVSATGWYHNAVDFMLENGYMNGISKTLFDVEGKLTRAQLVTILYRIAGEPETTGECPFTDIAADQWYTQAVTWAAENGIVNGMDETTFAPNLYITREQIAVILYRYSEAEAVEEDALAAFPDAEKVSDYAVEAMNWAVAVGLINGSDGKLLPGETATRAQIATIMMRFLRSEQGE